jgi:hypothetical protein
MRVYTRATQITVVAALLALGFDHKAVAGGLLAGLAVGLFSLWTAEATVKLLFNGGRHAGLKLAVAGLLKLPFLLAQLTVVAWAAYNGHLNIFAVVGGVLLVHGTMLMMVISTALANESTNRERYR